MQVFKDFCELFNILDILGNYKRSFKNGHYTLIIILFRSKICSNYIKLFRKKRKYLMMQFKIIERVLVELVKMLTVL